MSRTGFVYIMTNKNRTTLYIGVTNNLCRRVYEHKNHLVKDSFTDKYNLEYCIYYEEFPYFNQAIQREKELKNWNRQKKGELINKKNPEWKVLVTENGFVRNYVPFAQQVKSIIEELREHGEVLPSSTTEEPVIPNEAKRSEETAVQEKEIPPFGRNDDTVGNQIPPFGRNDDTVGNQIPPFGRNDDTVGNQIPSCGRNGDTVGNQIPPFGRNDDTVGNQIPSCGRNGDTVGNQIPPFGRNGDTVGNQIPPFGRNDDTVGNQIPPFGRNDDTVGNQIPPFGRNDSAPGLDLIEVFGGVAAKNLFSDTHETPVIPIEAKRSEETVEQDKKVSISNSHQTPVIPIEAKRSEETVTQDKEIPPCVRNDSMCNEELPIDYGINHKLL